MFIPRSVCVATSEKRSNSPSKQNFKDRIKKKRKVIDTKISERFPKVNNYTDNQSKVLIKKTDNIDSNNFKDNQDSDSDSRSDVSDSPIVEYSSEQRPPDESEPVCIVCGKYGEYICEKTDKDICSLECKGVHLRSLGLQPPIPFQSNISASESIDAEKEFVYLEDKSISELSNDQISKLRNSLTINVTGRNIVRPIIRFEDAHFPKQLLDNLRYCGYEQPTPIQMQCIPIILQRRDICFSANTASGKTAAFLLPIIATMNAFRQNNSKSNEKSVPLAFILCPTRELCVQIEQNAKDLSYHLPIKTALVTGGFPAPPQIYRLRRGVEIIVATPGRMIEILKSNSDISLEHIGVFVIDEVDMMLQMGFIEQVLELKRSFDKCQTILVSATIPRKIEALAKSFLSDHVRVSVGRIIGSSGGSVVSSVQQIVIWVKEISKRKKLFQVLNDERYYKPPIIVFVSSKIGADLLAKSIEEKLGNHCFSLHGDKSQNQRNSILQSFLDLDFPIIVSTPVLGRGLDLLNVNVVINFDMTINVSDYIHQIGRTSRMGAKGVAITFVNDTNKSIFRSFVRLLKSSNVAIPNELKSSPFLNDR